MDNIPIDSFNLLFKKFPGKFSEHILSKRRFAKIFKTKDFEKKNQKNEEFHKSFLLKRESTSDIISEMMKSKLEAYKNIEQNEIIDIKIDNKTSILVENEEKSDKLNIIIEENLNDKEIIHEIRKNNNNIINDNLLKIGEKTELTGIDIGDTPLPKMEENKPKIDENKEIIENEIKNFENKVDFEVSLNNIEVILVPDIKLSQFNKIENININKENSVDVPIKPISETSNVEKEGDSPCFNQKLEQIFSKDPNPMIKLVKFEENTENNKKNEIPLQTMQSLESPSFVKLESTISEINKEEQTTFSSDQLVFESYKKARSEIPSSLSNKMFHFSEGASNFDQTQKESPLIRTSDPEEQFHTFNSRISNHNILTQFSFEKRESEILTKLNNMEPKKVISEETNHLPQTEEITSPNTLCIKKKTIVEEIFNINCWGELQKQLKEEYNLINVENDVRKKSIELLTNSHINYYEKFLKLKVIKNSSKENNNNEENLKIFWKEPKKILLDMNENVIKLVLELSNQPKLIAQLIHLHNNKNNTEFDNLIETLSTSFFENLVVEEPYEINFLIFFAEILKLEINQCDSIKTFSSKILHGNNIIEKVLMNYLKNEKCEKYLKFLLRNPLQSMMKDSDSLELDKSKIMENEINGEKIIKQKKVRSSMINANKSAIDLNNSYNDIYKTLFEDPSNRININEHLSQETDDRIRYRSNLSPFLSFSAKNFSFFTKKTKNFDLNTTLITESGEYDDQISTNKSFDQSLYDSPLRTEQNETNSETITSEKIKRCKRLLNIFLDSIFSTIYNMPLMIRLICRLIKYLLIQKFGNNESEINCIFGNLVFVKWIIPKFVIPNFGKLMGISEQLRENLIFLGQILQYIVKCNLYDNREINKIELNSFIEENFIFMKEYYIELVNIGGNVIEEIFEEKKEKENFLNIINTQSVFLTLENVGSICQILYRQIIDKNINLEINENTQNLVKKIIDYDKQNNLFNKVYQMKDEKIKNLISKNRLYLMFLDIKFPMSLSCSNYQEILFKDEEGKKYTETEKLFNKTKNLMRKLLISIDKVNTTYNLTGRKNMNISEILDTYQEKSHIYDNTKLKMKQNIPLSTTAKFLQNCMVLLGSQYSENNCKKIFEEMNIEYEIRNEKSLETINITKLQISSAIENINKLNTGIESALQKQNKYKLSLILHTLILKKINFPICLTSYFGRKKLIDINKKNLKKIKKIPDFNELFLNEKIILSNQSECVHQKLIEIGLIPFEKSNDTRKTSLYKKNSAKYNLNYHCEYLEDFIVALCNLDEVSDSIEEGEDKYGINETMTLYLDSFKSQLQEDKDFKMYTTSEQTIMFNALEKYINLRIYLSIFPKEPTYKDVAFYSKLKVLDWIDYSHLEIHPRNRLDLMWDLAADSLKKVDLSMNPKEKLKNLTDCFKTIIDSLTLASNKNEAAGADDSLPILIYILLKALPSRLISNINFISLFCNPKMMFSQSGYSFTQLKSAISFIENINHKFVNLKEEDYKKKIKEKEKLYDVFYEKMRLKNDEIQLENENFLTTTMTRVSSKTTTSIPKKNNF